MVATACSPDGANVFVRAAGGDHWTPGSRLRDQRGTFIRHAVTSGSA